MNARTPSAEEDEFLAVAGEAVRRDPGGGALGALGWWDLLGELDDVDARTAVFALFRAQGRELASSGALSALLAAPYLEGEGVPAGTVGAVVGRSSVRRGEVLVLVGEVPTGHLLVDRHGAGARLVPVAEAELRPVAVPGRLVLHEVAVDDGAGSVLLAEARVGPARTLSTALGRLALALEVLGAAEATVELAVEHAGAREQFGRPIGTFQAVRHLLAWARTDCAAVAAVARQALLLHREAPPGFDAVVKALAGRNGRRACERTLQCLGGIGFTAEHPHHHFHSRVLAFDALLGTSTELARELGAGLRQAGTDPGIMLALLRGAGR